MLKEIIPYELEKELYELGFNNNKTIGVVVYKKNNSQEFSFISENHPTEWICGILYQQAFRWFREKYGLHSYIQPTAKNLFIYKIINVISFDCGLIELSETPSDKPQEAELACLKKLIEIAKNK